MPHRDIVIGVTPDLPGGAKYSGKDWKKWLTQRSNEWKVHWARISSSRYFEVELDFLPSKFLNSESLLNLRGSFLAVSTPTFASISVNY